MLMLVLQVTTRPYCQTLFQGLNPASPENPGQMEATNVVFEWKRKLRRQRSLEALAAERGRLGLRMRDKSTSDPSLVDIVHI